MHEPVLAAELLERIAVQPGGVYVDGTVGSGGHAAAVLERLGPDGFLLGLDRDPAALERAADRLKRWGNRVRLIHGDFGGMAETIASQGLGPVDGILLDLGVSSEQLEEAGRGFGFQRAGPLDMRMDPTRGRTAADLVREEGEDELRRILREYGEEPRAAAVARAVVRRRAAAPIEDTAALADVVRRALGGRRGRRRDPATRTFQALRIAVNGELESLRRIMRDGFGLLAVGGRMAAITFHSLEDRIVKQAFREHAGRWESLPEGGEVWRGTGPPARLIGRRPVRPSERETERNPRSRSAKLRVAERVAAPLVGKCRRTGAGKGDEDGR